MHLHHWFSRRRCEEGGELAFRFGPRGRHPHGEDDDGLGGPWGRRHHGGGRFGRMFGHGDLKLLLLSLIAEQPRHGYQLIRSIEEMFEGTYAPSPGAVYPTLTMLEEMGHAKVDTDDSGKKLYSATDAGRAYLEENRDAVEALVERTHMTARAMARAAAPMAIRQAMHTLKRALVLRGALWSADEAKRVRAIIARAAHEISRGGKDG